VHCQSVPSCMLPSGLAALQAQWLARSQSATTVPLSVLLGTRGDTRAPEPAAGKPVPDAQVESPFTDDADPMSHLLASDGAATPSVLPFVQPSSAPHASNDEMNAVEEAILLAQGIQTLPPEGLSLKQHLVNVERSLIEQALSRTQGNVSRTAKLLQLQRTTLIEKINKYELRAAG